MYPSPEDLQPQNNTHPYPPTHTHCVNPNAHPTPNSPSLSFSFYTPPNNSRNTFPTPPSHNYSHTLSPPWFKETTHNHNINPPLFSQIPLAFPNPSYTSLNPYIPNHYTQSTHTQHPPYTTSTKPSTSCIHPSTSHPKSPMYSSHITLPTTHNLHRPKNV